MRSELDLMKEKSSFASESLTQASKRTQSIQSVLNDKIDEVWFEATFD